MLELLDIPLPSLKASAAGAEQKIWVKTPLGKATVVLSTDIRPNGKARVRAEVDLPGEALDWKHTEEVDLIDLGKGPVALAIQVLSSATGAPPIIGTVVMELLEGLSKAIAGGGE